MTALEISERSRLEELEHVVERGLATFVEVGGALMEIRDHMLYRESHLKFEDYCQDRWGFTDRHARRLIEASRVAGLTGPMGPVTNERQARELAPLADAPQQLREAWERVQDDARPTTAAVVREHVQASTDQLAPVVSTGRPPTVRAAAMAVAAEARRERGGYFVPALAMHALHAALKKG